MLYIETKGSHRAMGRQLGEAFADPWRRCIDEFVPWMRDDLDTWRPAVGRVREVIGRHCPELLEETEGIAEAVDVDDDLLLGLRFFNEIKGYHDPGCSGLFVADSDRGPLLLRTSDLEPPPHISTDIQCARTSRPDDGPATITVGYLPLTGAPGLSEHGLAMTGSSMHAKPTPCKDGMPSAVINHRILRDCKTVADVIAYTRDMVMRGKGNVMLIGDAGGGSVMLEKPSGSPIVQTPRPATRDWQACSNLCFSPQVVEAGSANYVHNAWLRYGRISYRLADQPIPRTLAAVMDVAREIAQPGDLVGDEPKLHTIYAYVIELRNGIMHLAPGHPAHVDFQTLKL